LGDQESSWWVRMKRRLATKIALLAAAREVRQRTGKGVLRQFREIAGLRLGAGRLRAGDYYAYEAFDETLYDAAARKALVSWPHTLLSQRLNHPRWKLLCDDKLLTYAVLKGMALPFPEVYAVFDKDGRTYGDVPAFSTVAGMAGFLRAGMSYPAFGKRIHDSLGHGASLLRRLEPASDTLILGADEPMDIERYVRTVVATSPSGYLFQQRVTPHPDLAAVCGDRTCTVRMVMLLADEGPVLHRAVLRIPTGRAIPDNSDHGASGNAKAWLDPDSGVVKRVVRGVPPQTNGVRHLGMHGVPIEVHPDTGRPLVGLQVPEWRETVDLCMRTARAFPGLRYQCWDIAPSAEGPVIVELNARGFISQLPGGAGFNDARFQQFFARYGSV
jgi:hypothetical protein